MFLTKKWKFVTYLASILPFAGVTMFLHAVLVCPKQKIAHANELRDCYFTRENIVCIKMVSFFESIIHKII